MSMDIKKSISDWVDAHEAELIEDIKRLVRIRSVREAAAAGAPFGAGPRRALTEAMEVCEGYGYKTRVYGDCIGTADIAPDLPPRLDILAHLDTVSEGEGWTFDPFEAELKDGFLYGRGTDDDKGPAVEALYAMRCVSDLNLPLSGNCRLILGTDEESGFGDLPSYYKENAPAPNTFTPDAEFPVYNVEKGHLRAKIAKEFEAERLSPRVKSIKGGLAINIVPALAEAEILGLRAAELELMLTAKAKKMGVEIELVRRDEEDILLKVKGHAAHAAKPEQGTNAVTALLSLLDSLPLCDLPSTRAMSGLSKLFPHGDNEGEALGIAMSDDISGELTLALSLIEMDGGGIRAEFDSRVPVCATAENCRDIAEAAIREKGFSVLATQTPAHHTDGDGVFVRTLLDCYEEFTGVPGECLSMGGGTYVHDIEGGVAFGACFPGFVSNLHGPDERICVADALCAVKIFALAIARLCA